MIQLTEQWKNGKLESGFYYVYLKYLRMFDIATSSTLFGILERGNENCLEIITSVPSYEEWKELKEASNGLSKLMFKSLMNRFVKADEEKEKLAEENQQLKTQIAKLTEIIGVLPLNHSVSNLGYKIKNQRCEINNRIKEINKLKELLKECRTIMSKYISSDYVIELCERIDNITAEKCK